jgi:hypothetical protein
MNSKTISLLAVLGVGGYIAYSLYKKGQSGSPNSGYTPSTPSGGKTPTGKKKKLSYDDVMKLINATLNTFSDIKLTYDQKVTAVNEIKQMIDAGKSQQDIYIAMGNKYKLTTTQVDSIIQKLYA